MSAPELIVQTPGEPTSNPAPSAPAPDGATTQQPPAPALYAAKHNGGGRWIVVTNDEQAARVGDFVGNKESIVLEVERMNAGGEPFAAPVTGSQPPAPAVEQATEAIDPAKLKQPVLTDAGWLCPEIKAAKE